MSMCAAPAGSPRRTGKGKVAVQYQTARLCPVPSPAKVLTVTAPADESGSSGENLTDPRGGVFAHAAVRIDDETAEPILADLRRQADAAQSPEAKFAQFRTRLGAKRHSGSITIIGGS